MNSEEHAGSTTGCLRFAQIAKSGGLRFHSERFFQIIPIKMKRAISVRKPTLVMTTVRNTPVADRGVMSCLASFEAPKPNSPRLEMFRFQTQTARCEAAGIGRLTGCALCRRLWFRQNRPGHYWPLGVRRSIADFAVEGLAQCAFKVVQRQRTVACSITEVTGAINVGGLQHPQQTIER
jgi:hypothetical protein